jgi:triacylglycerol lipase
MWSSSWAMPFRTFHKRDVVHPSGLPVLLLHGYGGNSGYWHALSKVLMRSNITHHAIELEPVLGDIDNYVPAIRVAVEALCKDSGYAGIIIVAHSMGGLAARAYMRGHGRDRIAQLVTLGTPHHGTGIANFGAGINSSQMRWRGDAQHGTQSAWLRSLDESEGKATRARIVSIFSHHDNIVSPQTSSRLDGARMIEYEGIGHVSLALHPLIQARILAEIRNASARVA